MIVTTTPTVVAAEASTATKAMVISASRMIVRIVYRVMSWDLRPILPLRGAVPYCG